NQANPPETTFAISQPVLRDHASKGSRSPADVGRAEAMAWHRCRPFDLQYGKMAASLDNEGIMGTTVSERASEAQRCLYTIGHSNHPLDTFLGLLDAH